MKFGEKIQNFAINSKKVQPHTSKISWILNSESIQTNHIYEYQVNSKKILKNSRAGYLSLLYYAETRGGGGKNTRKKSVLEKLDSKEPIFKNTKISACHPTEWFTGYE